MSRIIIHDSPRRNQSAAKLWIFVCIDKDGNESPCGMNTGGGWLMMATSNPEFLKHLREEAVRMGQNAPEGQKIVLREYHDYTDLEEF